MLEALRAVIHQADTVADMDDASYAEFCALWHAAIISVKDSIYNGPQGGRCRYFEGRQLDPFTREEFERLWGGQSTIFMADILPFLHAKLIAHYRRKQVLKTLDVGAASGFGSQFLAGLHADHSIYARLEVEAVDINPERKRWVQAMAPDVNFRVADLFALPAKHWDIVVCSHVIEHVETPRPFIQRLVEVCRGFAFVYSPYNEIERCTGHYSTITEADYAGLPCEFHRIKSMGWHPNRPEDYCLLAVIDCR